MFHYICQWKFLICVNKYFESGMKTLDGRIGLRKLAVIPLRSES